MKDSGDVFFRTAELTISNVYNTHMHRIWKDCCHNAGKKYSHQRLTVIVEDVLKWLQVERILHWTIRANADSHHDIGHSCCPSVRKPIIHSLWPLNIHPKEQATKQKMQETNYHHPLIIEQANNKPPNKGNDPPCLTSWPQIEEHFTNNGIQIVADVSVYDPSLREIMPPTCKNNVMMYIENRD